MPSKRKIIEVHVMHIEFTVPQKNGKLKKITVAATYTGSKYREMKLAHNNGDLHVNRISNL